MRQLTHIKRILYGACLLLAALARPDMTGVMLATRAQPSRSADFCDCVTSIPANECQALVALYECTGGNTWHERGGWLTDCDPGSWYGVDVAKGHVVGLRLATNNLSGSLPAELSNLVHLEQMDLRGNHLAGALPASLGTLAALQDLDLALNALQGDLPVSMLAMRALRQLDLGYNGLYASDEPLRNFLDGLDPDWRYTQTVAPEGVQAFALSRTSALVFWTPPLYAESPGRYAIRTATLRDGPYMLRGFTERKTDSYLVISGLDPDHTHYFRIYAYTPAHDAQQNAIWSEGSWPMHDENDVVWEQEAEQGHLTYPMQVWPDAEASEGYFVASPDNSAGQVTLIFDLAERGAYSLWALSMGLDFDQNSFYLSIDGAPESHYELPALDGRWDWRWRKIYRAAASDRPIALLAGEHYVTLRAREIGARLDKLIVVKHPFSDPYPSTPWPTLPAATPWATYTPRPTATPDGKPALWLPLVLR